VSLFNTLKVGASGLGTSSLSLSVVGDNIANLNTVGFKRNQALFADMLPVGIGTLAGPAQLGAGAQTGSLRTHFEQGLLQNTGGVLDMAINGGGFFQVSNGGETMYTRDGSFLLDQDDYLVTSAGHRVQGYGATNGITASTPGDIQLDLGQFEPQASTGITLDANLDPDANDATALATLIGAGGLDGATTTMHQMAALDDVYQTSATVFDSLGRPHDVVVAFEKNGGTWTWTAYTDAGDTVINGAAGTDGNAFAIASGTAEFDADGNLQNWTETPTATAWNFQGADVMTFDLRTGFGTEDGSLTSLDGPSTVLGASQDGYGVGDLANLRVEADGSIVGSYTNGQERTLGQVGVATVAAEQGLQRMGGNLFRTTSASGEATMDKAGTGGRGEIQGFSLEGSNVSLEDEFVAMIQAQRSYQGNAATVRTSNETLQTLVNLV